MNVNHHTASSSSFKHSSTEGRSQFPPFSSSAGALCNPFAYPNTQDVLHLQKFPFPVWEGATGMMRTQASPEHLPFTAGYHLPLRTSLGLWKGALCSPAALAGESTPAGNWLP